MLRSESIKTYLNAVTYPDLADLYTPAMEVQVIVEQDNGIRVEGEYKGKQWVGYSDGMQTWKPFRIPHKANTNPENNDWELNWDLAEHAAGIGLTGWDWKNLVSRFVGFDFDAIVGHSDKHGSKLSNEQLREVEETAQKIDWVTVRRSTSGKGLHLYVFLDGVPTANHGEHAALARAILGQMSFEVGYDFFPKVDAMGWVLWQWHRKMIGTNGLQLIKQGTTLKKIPDHWQDHINVISGKRKRALPSSIVEVSKEDNSFEETCGQVNKVILDDQHRELIKWLDDNGFAAIWNADYHMLITHSFGLLKAYEHFSYKGVFKTMAEGSEQGDHNCFAFPQVNGAWVVRRYTPGTQEVETWDKDRNGYTRCFYNRMPDLTTVANSFKAPESKTGGYIFPFAFDAKKALERMDYYLDLPESAASMPAKLKKHKSGRVLVEIQYNDNHNPKDFSDAGFAKEGRSWTKILPIEAEPSASDETVNYDSYIRHLVTENGMDSGWVLRSDNQWHVEPLNHIRAALKTVSAPSNLLIGTAVFRPWTLMTRPFQPEYPGDRQWNREAPQLRYPPSTDLDNLSFPHWDAIFEHIGSGFDDDIARNDWCQKSSIKNGAEYLKCWVASILQAPLEPLPYLFLYSKAQCTGKSIFHEAFELLVTRGVVRADNALINQAGFNAELENAILCVIEEVDLQQNRQAKNRIKDWVTSRILPIHRKGQTPYDITNTTHYIQCSNDQSACPIFPGDSRIIMVEVPLLKNPIPKRQLIGMLQKEAPDFLAFLLAIELPESNDRLNLPVIETAQKIQIATSNRNELENFIEECIHYVPGELITVADFFDRFQLWLEPSAIPQWSKIKVGKNLPVKFPRGRRRKDAAWCYGNMSFEPKEANGRKIVVTGEFLDIIGDSHADRGTNSSTKAKN